MGSPVCRGPFSPPATPDVYFMGISGGDSGYCWCCLSGVGSLGNPAFLSFPFSAQWELGSGYRCLQQVSLSQQKLSGCCYEPPKSSLLQGH